MEIENDVDLKRASEEAGVLIQAIYDYCVSKNKTIADVPSAKVRFPRGFLRTAHYQRSRFPFLNNHALKSNTAYTLMLSDTILWLAIRTDIAGMPKDMLYKLFIFLVGTVMESTTKEYLKGICGKNFKSRTEYLFNEKIIEKGLKDDIDWLWDVRNRMHLFQLEGREYENDYCPQNHHRTIRAFRGLLTALDAQGVL